MLQVGDQHQCQCKHCGKLFFTTQFTIAPCRQSGRETEMLETLKPEMVVQQFVVKHYTSEERPTIKGNGFDGLEVGEDREDAEEFVGWLNERFSDIDRLREELDTHLKVHLGVVRENIRLRRALKSLVDWTTEKTPGWAPLEQARAALAAESETPLP